MTVFVILAAALVAGALLFVLPPVLGKGARARAVLLRQQQGQTALTILREQLEELKQDHAAGRIDDATYQRGREELEARVLEEATSSEAGQDARPLKSAAVIIALCVPLAAAGFYAWLGNPAGLDPANAVAQGGGDDGHQITPEQMAGLIEKLVDRLEADPSDPMGWLMLSRSYAMMGDFEGAGRAWQRIGSKAPEDAEVLLDWADILISTQKGDFSGEPDRLIKRALELDPTNSKGLALAGSGAYERGDFVVAAENWGKILQDIPVDDPSYLSVLESVNDARVRGGLEPLSVPENVAAAQAAAAENADLTLKGDVLVAPELAERVTGEEFVFVFVRPVEGGMPYAAMRFQASDLPASFDFTRAPRMNPEPVAGNVVVAARISRTGSATPVEGDLEGVVMDVSPTATGVQIIIDKVR